MQKNRSFLHLGLIVLFTFLVYANSLNNEFVYDDEPLIVKNDFIKDWKNLPKLFSKDYFVLAQEPYFRHVRTLTLFIDYSLWKLNPFGWHLTNIALHLANAILIYFLVSFILSHSSPEPINLLTYQPINAFSPSLPLLTTLLFALHPVHSEAVTFISGRMDPLCMFFFLLSFFLYLKSTVLSTYQLTNLSTYLLSLFSFILALFSKEMAITLPLVLFLYDFCFKNYKLNFKHFIRNYSGYFSIALFYIFLRLFFLKPTGFILGVDLSQTIFPPGWTLYKAVLLMSQVTIRYIGLLFFPFNLSVDRLLSVSSSFVEPVVILSLLSLGVILVGAKKMYKHSREMTFSILYFFVTLLPVSNLIPFGAIIAERYLYIPSLGLCIFLGVAIVKIARQLQNAQKRILQTFCLLCVFSILAFYSLRTFRRNLDWRNSYTLWSKTVQSVPQSWLGHNNLGRVYMERNLLGQAIEEFKKAIELDSSRWQSYYNLGTIYQQQGFYNESIINYEKTVSIAPENADAFNNLGVVYSLINRDGKAILAYKKAIALEPNFAEAYYNLGISYENIGQLEEALKVYQKAIELSPVYLKAYNNLGNVYYKKGEYEKAIVQYLKALEINPDFAEALNNLQEVKKILEKRK